ncbi:MAG: hypothetical protein HUJ52_03575, partial [Malacoplasma sp.]|nr:hypothetical protein [Malacoplasma sp.]
MTKTTIKHIIGKQEYLVEMDAINTEYSYAVGVREKSNNNDTLYIKSVTCYYVPNEQTYVPFNYLKKGDKATLCFWSKGYVYLGNFIIEENTCLPNTKQFLIRFRPEQIGAIETLNEDYTAGLGITIDEFSKKIGLKINDVLTSVDLILNEKGLRAKVNYGKGITLDSNNKITANIDSETMEFTEDGKIKAKSTGDVTKAYVDLQDSKLEEEIKEIKEEVTTTIGEVKQEVEDLKPVIDTKQSKLPTTTIKGKVLTSTEIAGQVEWKDTQTVDEYLVKAEVSGNTLTLTDNKGATVPFTPSGGGGGTADYNNLANKPAIGGKTLTKDSTANDLGLATKEQFNALTEEIARRVTKDYVDNGLEALKQYSDSEDTQFHKLAKEYTDEKVAGVNETISSMQQTITNIQSNKANKSFVIEQDNLVKEYADSQDNVVMNKVQTYIDAKDSEILTYSDSQDELLKDYTNEKSKENEMYSESQSIMAITISEQYSDSKNKELKEYSETNFNELKSNKQ